MTIKVQVKGVSDVSTLQAARPDLKIATPSIPAGHPNEAGLASALNAAQSAQTYAQQNDHLALANFLGATKSWRP